MPSSISIMTSRKKHQSAARFLGPSTQDVMLHSAEHTTKVPATAASASVVDFDRGYDPMDPRRIRHTTTKVASGRLLHRNVGSRFSKIILTVSAFILIFCTFASADEAAGVELWDSIALNNGMTIQNGQFAFIEDPDKPAPNWPVKKEGKYVQYVSTELKRGIGIVYLVVSVDLWDAAERLGIEWWHVRGEADNVANAAAQALSTSLADVILQRFDRYAQDICCAHIHTGDLKASIVAEVALYSLGSLSELFNVGAHVASLWNLKHTTGSPFPKRDVPNDNSTLPGAVYSNWNLTEEEAAGLSALARRYGSSSNSKPPSESGSRKRKRRLPDWEECRMLFMNDIGAPHVPLEPNSYWCCRGDDILFRA